MYIAFENDPNKEPKRGWIMCLLCVAFLLGAAQCCKGQVYKAVDIPKILGRTDSISRLELLTAKKFHQKLFERPEPPNLHAQHQQIANGRGHV